MPPISKKRQTGRQERRYRRGPDEDRAAAFAKAFAKRHGVRKLRALLHDLGDVSKTNVELADRWALTPQRVGQIRAVLFERILRLRPAVQNLLNGNVQVLQEKPQDR